MANNLLYDQLGGGGTSFPAGFQNKLNALQNFKKNFKGDPRQQVQQLLNSGKVSQAQYNQAVQMANALQKILGA